MNYLFDMSIDCSAQFEYALRYEQYDIAMIQVDRMLDIIQDIYTNIRFFTYFNKKKKYVLTLVYNLECFCKYSKNFHYGSDNENEHKNRCYQLRRRIHVYDDNLMDSSNIKLSLILAQELNRCFNLKKINRFYDGVANDKDTFFKNLIEWHYLNDKSAVLKYDTYDTRKSVCTSEEYKEFCKKIIY